MECHAIPPDALIRILHPRQVSLRKQAISLKTPLTEVNECNGDLSPTISLVVKFVRKTENASAHHVWRPTNSELSAGSRSLLVKSLENHQREPWK